jgi:integrase
MATVFRKNSKYAVQFGVPEDVRVQFGGIKKKNITIDASNDAEAQIIGDRLAREFKATVLQHRQNSLNGDRLDPSRQQQIVGWMLGRLYGQPNGFDLRERAKIIITEQQNDANPLFTGVRSDGLIFEAILESLKLLITAMRSGDPGKHSSAPKPSSHYFLEAYEKWTKITKTRAKTIRGYGNDVRQFIRWYEDAFQRNCYGADITEEHVDQYVERFVRKQVAKSTIKRALNALRTIYRVGRYKSTNPFDGVHHRVQIEGSRIDVRAFTRDEMRKLLSTRGLDHDAIMLLAYSGMRLSEATALRRKHLRKDDEDSSIWVFDLYNAGLRKNKSGYRLVPVHPLLLDLFLPIVDPEQPLIDTTCAGTLSKMLSRTIDTVTIDPTARAHSLRHTFITRLSKMGCPKDKRMAIVGHGIKDGHDGYTHGEAMGKLNKWVAKLSY